jgi:tetratricopeptide (TPR) repeat protein
MMKEFWLRRKIKRYEQNLEEHCDDPVYLQELAEGYIQLSQRTEAITYYHKAIEAYYQDNSRLGRNNAFILELCWALLKLEPMDRLAHNALGQEYCSIGEFEDATRLYHTFADELAKTDQDDEAILQYRNALVLSPDNIEIRQKCFSLLWRLRKKEEALQELRTIADIAERTGNIPKAVECYQKVLKILPASSEFQTELRRLVQLNRSDTPPLRLVVNT